MYWGIVSRLSSTVDLRLTDRAILIGPTKHRSCCDAIHRVPVPIHLCGRKPSFSSRGVAAHLCGRFGDLCILEWILDERRRLFVSSRALQS